LGKPLSKASEGGDSGEFRIADFELRIEGLEIRDQKSKI